jgi:hypothetical protein
MNPVGSPALRVLAMSLSDVRATIAQAQAAQAQSAQPADVILELSTAAQQLLRS